MPILRPSVRFWGALLVPLVLLEGALGVASAGSNRSSVSPLLEAHVGFGLLVVAAALLAVLWSPLAARPAARWSARLTALCVVTTGVTGAGFLLSGFAGGLVLDRALGVLDLVGALSMLLGGSVARPLRGDG